MQDGRAREGSLTSSSGTTQPQYPGLGLIVLILTATGVLSCLRHFLYRPPESMMQMVGLTAACTAFFYPWIGLAPMVFRLERRFPIATDRWPRNVVWLALLSLPVCALAAPVMSACYWAVQAAMAEGWEKSARFYWPWHFFSAQLLYWCSVAGGYTMRTQQELREQERRAAQLAIEKSELESSLKQAQLEVIRARLNPHFLFNSLQNIGTLAKQDPQTASRMLARLGDLLRAVLRQNSGLESTVEEEVDLARSYLAMERMRFGERLEVAWEIAEEARSALVPCFILQPLVENAIVHGLRGAGYKGRIEISAEAGDGELRLRIADNGVGLPAEDLDGLQLGVGLGSTRTRLEAMYGDRHRFEVRRRGEGGTEVRIVIPLRRTEAKIAAGANSRAVERAAAG